MLNGTSRGRGGEGGGRSGREGGGTRSEREGGRSGREEEEERGRGGEGRGSGGREGGKGRCVSLTVPSKCSPFQLRTVLHQDILCIHTFHCSHVSNLLTKRCVTCVVFVLGASSAVKVMSGSANNRHSHSKDSLCDHVILFIYSSFLKA